MSKRLILVAAVGRNGVIGDGHGMPWRLPSDMKRFRRLTMGKPVIMGRRTYESIGKPLADRLNIVVTRSQLAVAEGVRLAPDLDAALRLAWGHPTEEIMIIGGGEIYRATVDRADALYITHVDAAPEGSVVFPAIDAAVWKPVSREAVVAEPNDSAATEFVIYERAGQT